MRIYLPMPLSEGSFFMTGIIIGAIFPWAFNFIIWATKFLLDLGMPGLVIFDIIGGLSITHDYSRSIAEWILSLFTGCVITAVWVFFAIFVNAFLTSFFDAFSSR